MICINGLIIVFLKYLLFNKRKGSGDMIQQDIAGSALFVIIGIGLVLLIVGIGMIAGQKMKIKRCQEKTYGIVIGYRRRSRELLAPIVEYCVSGESYQKIRHFRGVIYKSWRHENEKPIEITKNDYVYLRKRMMTEKMAQDVWPLNMQMPVYYDPLKPQRAFVEKIPEKNPIVSIVLICLAIFMLILASGLFYLV